MTLTRQILTLAILALAVPLEAFAQEPSWEVERVGTNSWVEWDFLKGIATATNGVLIKYGGAVLIADRATVNRRTGEAHADGHVRIQRDDMVWVGEHITYNFKTRQMESEEFRTGRPPVFAGGEDLRGNTTNRVYVARPGYITTDDVSEPAQRIRATSIKIIPGDRVEARNAIVYLGKVPVFYFPYYRRNLDKNSNHFNFSPGYSSRFGGFLLGTYTFFINEELDGVLHLDYRTKRGMGTGADANLHLDRWGEAKFKYYYAHDLDPNADWDGTSIPADRQRAFFSYNANPYTNLNVKSRVDYQSDARLLHDFSESDYRQNPQPSTFVEVNKLWPNFSLDVYAQPRVNDFLETIERLPEVKLTAFRQQLGPLPVFYESESSAGWYQRLYSDTNSLAIPDYSAFRGDTFHQLTLPWMFFGWLNVTPRVGGRFTYYDSNTATNAGDQVSRGVFNTGVQVSFKSSRVWPAAKSDLLAVDGIRHIIEPGFNYAFVPNPSKQPSELPQFDYQVPSYRLLPIDFPDYNSVDSIDSQNVIRLGLRNKLQTKREGRVENLVWWDVYSDWRLQDYHGEERFSDLFSDFSFKPRTWLTLESILRWDMDDNRLNMAVHNLTFKPSDVWSWSIGHWFLRDGFMDDEGSSLITDTFLWRLSENWGLRAQHHFEARTGTMQEQDYGIYRDLRSWTAAVTFRVRNNINQADDYSVAFTFSLKAAPRFGLGSDTLRANSLLGN